MSEFLWGNSNKSALMRIVRRVRVNVDDWLERDGGGTWYWHQSKFGRGAKQSAVI